ncbi:MAG: hypothetical protein K1X79_11270 [Oligoflexia bacterium]|nr:hypothetical protein [Oligoflexia bacterium]
MNTPLYLLGPGALGMGLVRHLNNFVHLHLLVKPTHREHISVLIKQLAKQGHTTAPVVETSLPPKRLCATSQLWLCCKAYDLQAALKPMLGRISEFDCVVLCCNGLGVYQEVAELIGSGTPLVRVLCSTGFAFDPSGNVVQSGHLKFSISSAAKHQKQLHAIGDLLSLTGADLTFEKTVALAEWRKALANAVVNSLCTIENVKNGELLTNSGLKQQAILLLDEIRAVARCEHFDLTSPTNEAFFSGIANHAENLNSTLLDVRRGSRTETLYILERIVHIADSYGLAVPTARHTLERIKQVEARI